jgi:23S rRNA pseudouridine2457 synthase
MLIAFNKPYGVLSQFTPEGSNTATLKAFQFPENVYPLGRLDADSEGLLLLSDEPGLNTRLLKPEHRHHRTYWSQVERIPSQESLNKLQSGVTIQGMRTLPCRAWIIEPQPNISDRTPPIRFRKSVETCWISLELVEGKNRQVRKMTAAVGHPTLRLIRMQIGNYQLGSLEPGKWKVLSPAERRQVFE